MADAEFEVVVAKLDRLERLIKNIDNLVESQKKLDKMPKVLGKAEPAAKNLNRELEKTPIRMSSIDRAMSTSTSSLEEFTDTRELSGFNNILGETRDRFEDAAAEMIILANAGGRLGVLGSNILEIGDSLQVLEGTTQGLGQVFSTFGQGMRSAAKEGVGAVGSLRAGFSSTFAAIKAGSISATATLSGLGTALLAVLGPVVAAIAAIGAAVFVLKRIWDANIGGIQTKFTKVIGQIKTAWGEFNANFTKTLQKLSPLFDAVFSPIFAALKVGFAIFKGAVTIIGAALKPIIDALSEMGDELSEVFGLGGKEGKMLETVVKAIGVSAKITGKILGTIIKIAITPTKILIKSFKVIKTLIVGVFGVYKSLFDVLKNTRPFKAILSIVTKIAQVFTTVKDVVMTTVEFLFDKVVGVVNKIPDTFLPEGLQALKTEGSPAAQVAQSTTNNRRTVNNNQQITFNTNRPTNPDAAAQFTRVLAKQLQVM